MKNIKDISFRRLTQAQAEAVERLLRKSKSPYPKLFGLAVICMLPAVAYSAWRKAPILHYLVIILILLLYLGIDCSQRRYRIKCCRNMRIFVTDAVCINIKRQNVSHRYRVSYYFQNAQGESFKLKGRSLLDTKPAVGSKYSIVNFGNRFYSVTNVMR